MIDTIDLDSTPTTIEFSPNSERVAIGTIRGKVIVWDVISKTTTIQCHDHTNAISCVTFDQEERILDIVQNKVEFRDGVCSRIFPQGRYPEDEGRTDREYLS